MALYKSKRVENSDYINKPMVDPLLLFYKKMILKTQAPEFLLALLSFLFTFVILTIYLGQSDWGKEFVSPYKMSDAALYLHKAWYMAFVNEDGGSLASFIPVSPYVTIQSFAYKLFGPYVVTPFITNIILLSTASVFLTLLTFNLFDKRSAIFTLVILKNQQVRIFVHQKLGIVL